MADADTPPGAALDSQSSASDSHAGNSQTLQASLDNERVQNNLKARKRTKTGCLTCRKRRIKCGEERPTCANCIKSKRSCEGYAPRLTFKDPLGAFNPGWAARANSGYRPNAAQLGAMGMYARVQPGSANQSQFPPIAPRPVAQGAPGDFYSGANSSAASWPNEEQGASPTNYGGPVQPNGHLHHNLHRRRSPDALLAQAGSTGGGGGSVELTGDGHGSMPSQWLRNSVMTELENNQHGMAQEHHRLSSPLDSRPPEYGGSFPSAEQAAQSGASDHPMHARFHPDPYTLSLSPQIYGDATFHPAVSRQEMSSGMLATQTGQSWQQQPQSSGVLAPPTHAFSTNGPLLSHGTPFQEPDDDYYDVDSDEDMTVAEQHASSTPQHDLGLMLALSASREDQIVRSYHAFLDRPHILTTYTPKFTASPLMDSTTARLFCHFITATAPFLSIYERHPVNPWVIFSGKPVPKFQQAVWTYVLPMMALSNQGLLQSMLAVATLQISRLQQTTATVPMRHYHYALRKVAKAVSTPTRRTSIPTLAATLILAHFEATAGEHAMWSSHLAGARQLLWEIDFQGTTRRIKAMKAKAAGNRSGDWYNPYVGTHANPTTTEIPWIPESNGIDEQIVSQIIGWKIRYDQFGSVIEDEANGNKPDLSEKEMDDYQIYRDLFWFFCKQDVIQSIISGKSLLLPFDRWVHCPPRGPIGKIDAVYGTMDHVLLLIGRVADFASRDQPRKLKAAAANGGTWRPPGGAFRQSPSSGPRSSPGAGGPAESGGSGGSPLQQPPVMPLNAFESMHNAPMPDAFAQAPRDKIYNPPSPDDDFELSTATAEAEKEWEEIQTAFGVFEQSMGPGFAPLPADAAPTIETPFGNAVQYRTHHIATIWTYFYTARIIAARTHPSMPPASIMAAGIAAAQTAPWTNIIGRISLGLQPPPIDQPMNPAFGAAMTETILSLFFAGVSFTDAEQRAATIQRLRVVAVRVGADSAALIAAGLETVWVKVAQAGRGPPYERTLDLSESEAVSGRKLTRMQASGNSTIVYVPQGMRTNWGKGLMSLEEDFKELAVAKNAKMIAS